MEYRVDCTGWSKEHLLEIFTAFPQSSNTKIVLCWEESNNNAEISKEKLIGNCLNSLGVPCHLKGYGYLKYSILRSLNNPEELESVTKILYPAIAKEFDTTSGRVEHGIRHAIQRACENGKTKEWENIFGKNYSCGNYKPTNSQFIASLSDYISMNYQA